MPEREVAANLSDQSYPVPQVLGEYTAAWTLWKSIEASEVGAFDLLITASIVPPKAAPELKSLHIVAPGQGFGGLAKALRDVARDERPQMASDPDQVTG